MTGRDLDALQKRSLATLMTGQALATGANVSVVAAIGLLASAVMGSDHVAGLPAALGTLGTALAAAPLANRASRLGRRPALWAGYLVGALGAVVAAVAGQVGQFWLLMAGMILFGAGQASSLQTRFAATDLAEADRRGRAIALVVWIGTIGGVVGPVLNPFVDRLGRSGGLEEWVGPILMAALLFAAAAAWTAIRLRPDPLRIRLDLQGVTASGSSPRGRLQGAIAAVRREPMAVLALAIVSISQAAMVAVMTMTPLHLRDHGQADLAGLVIAVHVFGMFGLAPLVGRYADRAGNLRAARDGGLILVAGIIASVAAGYQPVLIFAGLFLLGLGWNFGLIAGSSLLTDALADESRVAAQGLSDLMLSLLGATAALASGLIKESLGFHWLANLSAAAALAMVAWVMAAGRRRPAVAATKPG